MLLLSGAAQIILEEVKPRDARGSKNFVVCGSAEFDNQFSAYYTNTALVIKPCY